MFFLYHAEVAKRMKISSVLQLRQLVRAAAGFLMLITGVDIAPPVPDVWQ